MVDLTFGMSLQKTARYIAITDMVYCFFSVIIRTAVWVVQAVYSLEIRPNNFTTAAVTGGPTTMSPNGTVSTKSPGGPHGENLIELQLDVVTVFEFFVLIMGLVVAYIGFELWMCRTLLSASNNLDRDACKKWWWNRLSMTLVLLFMCVMMTLVVIRDWFSWLLELVIFYRIYELYIIHLFKNDIAATTNRSQI